MIDSKDSKNMHFSLLFTLSVLERTKEVVKVEIVLRHGSGWETAGLSQARGGVRSLLPWTSGTLLKLGGSFPTLVGGQLPLPVSSRYEGPALGLERRCGVLLWGRHISLRWGKWIARGTPECPQVAVSCVLGERDMTSLS